MKFYFNLRCSLLAYHAGLNNKTRTAVLDSWISYKVQVVVATVAFGYVVWYYLYFILSLAATNRQFEWDDITYNYFGISKAKIAK